MTMTVNGLEEIKALVGRHLGPTTWREITQDRIDAFADATDDHQWIHVDVRRASRGPFGAPIAHGHLTLSLLVPMFTELVCIDGVTRTVNYGLDRIRFPQPVAVGSKIRLGATVVSAEDTADGGLHLVVDQTIEIDGSDRPACVARALHRYYR